MANKKPDYAKWKLVAWRFVRVFLSSFLVTLSATMADAVNWDSFYPVVIYPALIAGLSALFKALREAYGRANFNSMIDRFPL